MKTREAALYGFFSGFGIPAFADTATPEDAEMPYITYSLAIGDLYDDVTIEANLWYYTESEAEPNAKVREIEKVLGSGGKLLTYDGGAVWIKKGRPWCQSVKDVDNSVKRRYFNFDLSFFEL